MYRKVKLIWAARMYVFPAGMALIAIRVGLSWLPYRRVLHLLDKTSARRSTPRDPDAYLAGVAWAVQAIGRRILGDRPCLPQALAARWLLRRNGQDVRLHIGVRKEEEGLAAHAWLEKDGRIVVGGGQSSTSFTPLHGINPAVL